MPYPRADPGAGHLAGCSQRTREQILDVITVDTPCQLASTDDLDKHEHDPSRRTVEHG